MTFPCCSSATTFQSFTAERSRFRDPVSAFPVCPYQQVLVTSLGVFSSYLKSGGRECLEVGIPKKKVGPCSPQLSSPGTRRGPHISGESGCGLSASHTTTESNAPGLVALPRSHEINPGS